jgi:hypothetical protein
MHILDIILNYIFWVPVIVLPLLIFVWFRFLFKLAKQKVKATAKTKVPGAPFLLFGIPILIMFLFSNIIQLKERQRILSWLDQNSTNVTISVNNSVNTNTVPLIAELKSIHPVSAHHSHPTRSYRIELRGKTDTLLLDAARDSSTPNEYWIFSPLYRTTSNNEIGRIRSESFTALLISHDL